MFDCNEGKKGKQCLSEMSECISIDYKLEKKAAEKKAKDEEKAKK